MEQYLLQFITDLARLSAWLLILVSVFGTLERFFYLNQQKFVRKEFFVDLLYYVLNNILPKLLMVIPMAGIAWAAKHVMPDAFLLSVAKLPFWARCIAALLVGEVGFYWGHRWTHEIPLLWRFHAIHHSAEEMDWLVGSRAHPLDMVFTRLCGYVPLYILGLANPTGGVMDGVTLAVLFASTFWGFFIHANLKWRFGPFEWILATPSFHHWHHTYDGPIDRNYSSMVPLLDLIFGTYHNPKGEWPERYGTETQVSPHIADQLLDPIFPPKPEAIET